MEEEEAKEMGGSSDNQANRSSFTGTVDEIGGDILRLKQIGVDHLIFGLLPDIQGNMELGNS